MAALRDIRTATVERGHRIPVFIQDRTVIEDTGSTIDLIRRGWTLYNHPERLAYSATPPDFGSLVIQRRRWSNGGLIILPDLFRYTAMNRWKPSAWLQFFVRAHYLLSPTVGTIGVLILLLHPIDPALAGPWLPLAAAPYYYVYGRDLVRSGYRWIDLLRIYSLNLMLIPVNLAGVLASLRQAITGRKASFGRTPKIADRTATGPIFILANGIITAHLAFTAGCDFAADHYNSAIFCGLNAAFLVYGFHRYLGWRECLIDLSIPLRSWWRGPVTAAWARGRNRASKAGTLLPEARPLEIAE